MKKKIRQAYFLLIAGILANISLFTAATLPQTGWQYDKPGVHSCFEISESQPIIINPESPSLAYSNDRPMAPEELEIIQSIKKPDNITEEIIDPTQDQIIRCPQGSILHLEANTLVNQQGENATEPVVIRVKECYKLKDIIANKLTTTSDGKLIETAGMVEITALAGNDTLSLAANKDIDIAMPGGAGEGFELFNASTDSLGNMNWILDENNPIRKKYIDARKVNNVDDCGVGTRDNSQLKELFEEDTTCNFGITHFILEETAGNYEMQPFNFIDHKGNRLSQFLESNFKADNKTISNACTSNDRFSVSLNIDYKGKLNNPEIDKGIASNTRKSLSRVLKDSPVLNRNFFDPVSNGRERLKIIFGDKSKKNTKPEELKTADDRNTPWMNRRNNSAINSMNQKMLSYYVMSSMNLGWINCDRYPRQARNLVSVNLDVSDPGIDEVLVVFENSQSAVPTYRSGNHMYISNRLIPVNSNLKVICMVNDNLKPKIFTYRIKAGINRVYRIKQNQPTEEQDPGEEINTPA